VRNLAGVPEPLVWIVLIIVFAVGRSLLWQWWQDQRRPRP